MTTQKILVAAFRDLVKFMYKKKFIQKQFHIELVVLKNPHVGEAIPKIRGQLYEGDVVELTEALHERVDEKRHPRREGPGIDR